MNRRSKLWQVVAALFAVINLGGAGIAAAGGEGLHAAVHVGLLLGGYLVWRLVPQAGRQDPRSVHSAEDHLEQLQESVDAIALDVERIGEAQRFMVKLEQERAETSPQNRQP